MCRFEVDARGVFYNVEQQIYGIYVVNNMDIHDLIAYIHQEDWNNVSEQWDNLLEYHKDLFVKFQYIIDTMEMYLFMEATCVYDKNNSFSHITCVILNVSKQDYMTITI